MEGTIDIQINSGTRAAKEHKCELCSDLIKRGSKYTHMTSRLKTERFPTQFRVCNKHQPGLIPLGLLLNR